MEPTPESNGEDCACPTDSRIARFFDARTAERLAQRQEPGPVAVTQRLSAALVSMDPTGKTVLELGCGRGLLLLGLTQAGAAHATGVDLSPASIDAARDRFKRAQLSERADLSVGDAARVPLEPHDWVILDRVICCYPDVERLLANTLPAAKQIYAFTTPTSRGWLGALARLEQWVEDVWNGLRGQPCPGYVHSLDLIEARLASAGFRLRHRDRKRHWQIAVYERSAEARDSPPEPDR
ncbi:MAG TPA: class I SAM-dependent methyltransferase [Candidatus Eisenbacteria bacterium]|nr:class I SAM-dependent methyltransferase [Candidatus Eisenbacteria bacterium]